MADFAYTKKVIMYHTVPESRDVHESQPDYEDWYYNQVEAGLADPYQHFTEYQWTSPTTVEILVTDQVQAESFYALCITVGERIGFPLTGAIVDYTE